MSWIRFDNDAARQSAWWRKLTDGQRYAFLALVHFASRKPRGFVKKQPVDILADNCLCDAENLGEVLTLAMNSHNPITGQFEPKILDHGDRYEIVDYYKFNPPHEEDPEDVAERVRRHRERMKRNVTDVTESNACNAPTITSTITNTSTNTSTKEVGEESPTTPLAVATPKIERASKKSKKRPSNGYIAKQDIPIPLLGFLERLEKLREKYPAIAAVDWDAVPATSLNHLEARTKEKPWNEDKIFEAIENLPWYNGTDPRSEGWAVSLDWLVSAKRGEPPNYLKLMKRYDSSVAAGDIDEFPEGVHGINF